MYYYGDVRLRMIHEYKSYAENFVLKDSVDQN